MQGLLPVISVKEKNDCIFAKLIFKWDECFESSYCVVIGLLPGEKNIQIENRKTDPPLTQSNFLWDSAEPRPSLNHMSKHTDAFS